jgi:hypothetical protein
MWYCAEDDAGYRPLWLPARSWITARKFVAWAGLQFYIPAVGPWENYDAAKAFVDGIPMCVVGR